MANRAPGALALVQDFVNTCELDEGTDTVDTPVALGAWLAERGLLPEGRAGSVDAAEHARAIALREALRSLLLANGGEALEAGAVDTLNAAAERSGLRPQFTGSTVALAPADVGADGALGRLLAIVSSAMADGTWERLKACSEHSCRWAFFDLSKNRSGHWCNMRVCGNRAKARQFRARRRAGSGPA